MGAGIEKEAIAEAVRNFPGIPHRLEYVCRWNGVDFFNDSKATNYDASAVGLRAVPAPVLLIGSAAEFLAKRLQKINFRNYEIVENMQRAVIKGAALSKTYDAKVVLLSPACASFDQYQNFEERGNDFRKLSLALNQKKK